MAFKTMKAVHWLLAIFALYGGVLLTGQAYDWFDLSIRSATIEPIVQLVAGIAVIASAVYAFKRC